jgi:hypothetical protein
MSLTSEREAYEWQVGVWNRISQLYFGEIDRSGDRRRDTPRRPEVRGKGA